MAYVQKLLSKKVSAGKSQVLFLIAVNRNVRFRYKTPCFVEPELWNPKTNDLRVITKATKLPPEGMKALRDYKDVFANLEKKIEYLISEFPEQVVMKIIPPHATGEVKEDYWMNVVLNEIKDISYANLTREDVEQIFIKEEKKDFSGESADFFALTKTFLANRTVCKCRYNAYNVVWRSMARYEIFRNKIMGTTWHWNIDMVTSTDLSDFFNYFRHEKDYRDKYSKLFDEMMEKYPVECTKKHKNQQMKAKGDNYMANIQKRVKAFWNWLLQNRYTVNNPFVGLELCHETYGVPYYITIEERNKILGMDYSANAPKEVQRDIFVFQCLVGCRVGDMERLTPSNVVDGILIYTPRKTKDERIPVLVRVPLCQRALDIIEKYKGLDPKGRLLPFIARQNYNDYIKEILEDCEITRMVNVRDSVTGENKMCRICDVASSHMARRTFIGNAYKQVKDANLVGKMSGHVDGSKAFARYRAVDDDMLREVVNAIQ